MVGMVVDRPMGEDYRRLFRFQKATKLLVMCGINDRSAIELTRKRRPRLENVASSCGFGHTDWTWVVARLVRPLPLI